MRTFSWSSKAAALAAGLFGGSCYLCRGASERAIICEECDADLPRLPAQCCPRCALPTTSGLACGRCLAQPPAFDATQAAFAYAFPADALVQGLKFRSELALAPFLADALCDALAACGQTRLSADLVVPVPLHAQKLRQRGYNQAMEIARGVAARMRVPLEADLCQRVRDTAAQVELPWAQRQKNVRGAFSCRRALDGKVVAVLDDVMTTGATLAEVAATLKTFGALRVVNWVVARTLPD